MIGKCRTCKNHKKKIKFKAKARIDNVINSWQITTELGQKQKALFCRICVTGIEIKQNISVLQCQTRRKIQFAMGGDCGGGSFAWILSTWQRIRRILFERKKKYKYINKRNGFLQEKQQQ